MNQTPIILASRSPRRIELLKLITNEFEVVPSCFDESKVQHTNPTKLVEELSFQKANVVKEQYKNHTIIGCDTVVSLDDEIFGIPSDYEMAKQMIQKLSGKTHTVITGVSVLDMHTVTTFHCKTDITFYDLTEQEIEDYIQSNEPYDKAGGYGIQAKGGLFVKKIEGDYYNVVGLPIAPLNQVIKQLKFKSE